MPKPKRVSQSAVAKALGVSRATVSLVLRGGHGASESTRARVLAASNKMGYRPNALVHSIRSGRSKTVGVLAQPHDSYWRDVCYGIHDRLIDSEHLPIFLWTNGHMQTGRAEYSLKQIHRMLDRWVDGVILWPFFADLYVQHLHEFRNRNIPIVLVDYALEGVEADIIASDERQIAALLSAHVREQGHRNILIVTGPDPSGWAEERAHELSAAWESVPGAKTRVVQVRLEPYRAASAKAAIADALREDPKITAVHACTDIIARYTYDAANQLGWSIPDRLSVTGAADLDFAALMSPPLTTIHQDGYAIGQRAAQVELERSAGLLVGPARRFKEPAELIIRQSTAIAPSL